jgi:hypothetical protein
MSGYEGFDIDRSTEQAWVDFRARLAEVLSMMDSTEPLTLSSHDGQADLAGSVKFVAPSRDRLLALVPSHDRSPQNHQLSGDEIEDLLALGWRSPAPTDDEETATHLWALGSQAESDRLAWLATTTLRNIFGVHHPVFLASDVLAEILHGAPVEGTHGELVAVPVVQASDITAIMPANAAHLAELVAAVLEAVPDITPIRDADGDLAIRVGSAMVFVRVPPDGREVLVFAPVVHDVDGRSRATEVLNDINAHARWVRFALLRDRVFVTMSILARPFVPAHLRQAIAEVCKVADGVDDLLAQSLHGRTTFAQEL